MGGADLTGPLRDTLSRVLPVGTRNSSPDLLSYPDTQMLRFFGSRVLVTLPLNEYQFKAQGYSGDL